MLNRKILLALGTATAVALAPAATLAKGGHHGGGKHAHHHHHHHHHHHKFVRWHRWKVPVVIGTTAVATYAATKSTCTCLTKEYLADGTVVFKDVCSNEMAMNPPSGKQAETR
jgi:ABC-type Zn2+ transport system substrate-binding protein/surface adhesin